MAGLLLVVWLRLQPPEALGAEAPPDVFSATRAAALRARLLEGLGPHRVEQPANAELRERLLAELRALGYSPRVQSGFACSGSGSCARVQNILVRVEGTGPRAGGRHAVMLAAHYDSVGAGPGASDDFNGTATLLEVARILKQAPAPRNDIILLLTDGEEEGLLGARAFVRHPWASEVRVALNVEARGTSGQSLMFETGPDNAWLLALYGRHVARPATNSLSTAIYKRLPNDTDFTVFQGAGITGLNFANVADVVHYHTPLDDLVHSSPRTIQHHGDNVLALLRALASEDLSATPRGDAAFMDVLGLATLHWPLGLTPWLAVLGLVLVGAAAWRQARQESLSPRQLLWASLGLWGLVVLGALVGLGLSLLLKASGAAPRPWVAHPTPALAACALLVLAGFLLVGAVVSRRAGGVARWSGVWLGWALLVVGLSLVFAEGTPSLLLPVLGAGGAGLLAGGERGRGVASLVGTALAGVFLLPLCFLLQDTLGFTALPGVGAVGGLVLATLLPVFPVELPRARALTGAVAGLGMLLVLGAVLAPPYSAHAPQRLNLVYRFDQDRREARWSLEGDLRRIPAPLADFQQGTRRKSTPWASRADALSLPAEAPPFSAPELETVRETRTERGRVLEVRLRSTRGASRLSAAVPPEVRLLSMRVNGEAVPVQGERVRARFQGWRHMECATEAAEGCVLELTQEGEAPFELRISDESPGLPPGLFQRQAQWSDFVQAQDGDVTVATRTVRL